MITLVKSMFDRGQAKKEASVISRVEMPYYKLNNEASYLEHITKRLPLASSCIALRARKVRTTPWKIVNEKGEPVKDIPKVFTYPNSYQRFEDILELIVWYLDCIGNAYLFNSKNGLFFLHPSKIEIYQIENTFITGYEYRTLDDIFTLTPREVIHLRYPNPLTPIYGMGLIQQGEILLQKNLNRDVYSEKFYKNGTVLSGIFASDAVNVSTEQRERMESQFKNKLSGVGNFFRTFFLWAGFKYQPITQSQRDSQDVEQAKMTRDDILAVCGVPGALLGFTDGVNFSNAEIQERVFINFTLIPLLQRIEQMITFELLQGTGLKFEFMKPVHENLTLKSAWVDKAFSSSIITKEEYRQLMGIIDYAKMSGKNTGKF